MTIKVEPSVTNDKYFSLEKRQTVYATVMSWNLDRVKQYILNNALLTKDRVPLIEKEYKRFMILTVFFPEKEIPIAREVDIMWHTHILFTRDYFAFCSEINEGKYVHHNPAVEQDEIDKLFMTYQDNTLELYKYTFGDIDKTIWEDNAQICSGS